MADPNLNSSEASTDFRLQDVEAIFDDFDSLDEDELPPAKSNGEARRSLEERREAQRLRRLLSDYAWDDREI